MELAKEKEKLPSSQHPVRMELLALNTVHSWPVYYTVKYDCFQAEQQAKMGTFFLYNIANRFDSSPIYNPAQLTAQMESLLDDSGPGSGSEQSNHFAGNISDFYVSDSESESEDAGLSSGPLTPVRTRPQAENVKPLTLASSIPQVNPSGPQSQPSPSTSTLKLSAGPSKTPRKTPAKVKKYEKKWQAYVVYRGSQTGAFSRWTDVNAIIEQNPTTIYKGFHTYDFARQSFRQTQKSGILDALKDSDKSRPRFYCLVQGFAPGVYTSGFDLLNDGVSFGGGIVYVFDNAAEANALFVREFMANRVVKTPEPALGF
ncbi:hypothetical protein D9758_008225 [Tetrapyrgos nigripes]|uniref:Ribonuclease H1 N-terminal domain-containing protein n=1 Tax=Tetrapyrgos nigripes TaxID=182062 RepID=A0A8H5G1I9_9AGAR|nr:hypothetical protein D9758_008225 [Tetrapyrgos nigripes]